jgi:putative flippase GtrA
VFLPLTIAWISIFVSAACALWIALDEIRYPQKMGVMNVVWPISPLYFSFIAVWAYFRVGRTRTKAAKSLHDSGDPQGGQPTAWQVAIGTSHCAAGCMIADVICDFAIAAEGIRLFGSPLWAEYAIDLAAAWAVGIIFQYFAIKPMRDISTTQGIVAAIKADSLSIAAFQVGMYTWMALTYFFLFPHPHLTAFDPRYWLMMQAAMICGFFTAYPVNRWLIRRGLKEAM